MAPVLSFMHVVIVHINFHHPSYTGYYRAYQHRRPGLHHSPIPQSCLHAGGIASLSDCSLCNRTRLWPCSPHPLSGTAVANSAPLFKEASMVFWKTTRPGADQCPWPRRGKPSHFHWHLTSSNCCRPIYLPRFGKNKTEKKTQHSGETFGWPASTASIKAHVL